MKEEMEFCFLLLHFVFIKSLINRPDDPLKPNP